MKTVNWFLGFLAALSIILVLLITSFELVVYRGDSYFQKKYEKYQVLEDVPMEMEDLLELSEEMMDYLRGDREDLTIVTTIDGEEREFFNQKEKDHMADVRDLFLGGIVIRRVAVAVILGIIALLFFMGKNPSKTLLVLSKAYMITVAILAAALGAVAIGMLIDFTRIFTIFHEIFFTNDLWLLNPKTDLLINVLPEGFFVDTAKEIGIVFGVSLLITIAGAVMILIVQRNKDEFKKA